MRIRYSRERANIIVASILSSRYTAHVHSKIYWPIYTPKHPPQCTSEPMYNSQLKHPRIAPAVIIWPLCVHLEVLLEPEGQGQVETGDPTRVQPGRRSRPNS